MFDPDAAAKPGSGIFGLPCGAEESAIHLLGVPFDATTSFGGGAMDGPAAIFEASAQVDLFDIQFGRPYQAGIFMAPPSDEIARLSTQARKAALPIIERGGAEAGDELSVRLVDAACERVRCWARDWTRAALNVGKFPGLVGGDHSTPLGCIEACAEHASRLDPVGGLGVLQVDAHMDLRDAFEGFRYSHASIMHNVLKEAAGVKRLVQVGIRDFGEGERAAVEASGGRVVSHYDHEWVCRIAEGESFQSLVKRAIDVLPRLVYISFDIDGLDPSLCPHTGTPVPGGLSFSQAALVIELLVKSGRRLVGFDLNEVVPGGDDGSAGWDGTVGARVLYKLCGAAAAGRVGV